MAHELERIGKTDAGKNSKKYLNRREYIKTSMTAAAIVAGSGLIDSTSAVEDVEAYGTDFGEYIS